MDKIDTKTTTTITIVSPKTTTVDIRENYLNNFVWSIVPITSRGL
ncbi:Uncharacterised protein [uncultured archaeon]|nr:Uncharacterised protein [uncultured archaeon]